MKHITRTLFSAALIAVLALGPTTIRAEATVPAGTVVAFAGITVPTGWLLCYGQAVSRTTYKNLFNALVKKRVVTISAAVAGAVTFTGHGLRAGDPVIFTTTGDLPTNITASTVYYAKTITSANVFTIAATVGGTAIDTTSGTQTGVQTCTSLPFGVGDGSTTFNIPDLRGRVFAGADNMGGTAASRLTTTVSPAGSSLGAAGGAQSAVLTSAEVSAAVNGDDYVSTSGNKEFGGSAVSKIQPTLVGNYIIYTGD